MCRTIIQQLITMMIFPEKLLLNTITHTDETVKQGPWLSYKIFLYYNEPELRYSVFSPIPVKPISKYLLVRTLFTKYRCTIL